MDNIKLAWGLSPTRPCKAAWGARLIADEVVAGGRGLVGSRIDSAGDPTALHDLYGWLDTGDAFPRLIAWAGTLPRSATYGGGGGPSEVHAEFGSPDGTYLLRARACGGYIYVGAILKEDPHV